MNKHPFHPKNCLALLLALILVACTAAPSPIPPPSPTLPLPTDTPAQTMPLPTDTPAEPTKAPRPTQSPPPADGSYQVTITAEDYEGSFTPEDELCEATGTFILTVSGSHWFIHQDPAPGCTVKWHSWSGTWDFGDDYVAFQRDLGGSPYLYYWKYNGNELRFTKFMDESDNRYVWMGSHPWVKLAQTAEIPLQFQQLDLWEDATASTIGVTAEETYKVELADINEDGLVDILFPNGGSFDTPGTSALSRVFLNQGPGKMFQDVSEAVFGPTKTHAQIIKVRDVNDDGNVDIMVGTTDQTQSRLFLGKGSGVFDDVTATHLPQIKASASDLEFGDVDGDGDLDLVLADRGTVIDQVGRTMLWLNDGAGHFADATATQMPDILVELSWEIELIDSDNDTDLDILVSCRNCAHNYLFENDGNGSFQDTATDKINLTFVPTDIEVMDLNGDGYIDLITLDGNEQTREHLFLNDQQGGFDDATDELWSEVIANVGCNDDSAVFMDYNSDGTADVLLGSWSCPDRLWINDGTGNMSVYTQVFTGKKTTATLGLAAADFNGDHKLDVAMAQGLGDSSSIDERVFLGKNIAPDTAPPVITLLGIGKASDAGQPLQVRARVHDNKSPTMPHDWQSVTLKWTAGEKTGEAPMQWYGEYLWRAAIGGAPAGELSYQVCATDAAGNTACSEPESVTVE